MPDAARLAFQRPPEGERTGPPSLRDRVTRFGGAFGDVPTRQIAAAVVITLAGAGLLLGWAIHVSWTPLVDVGLIVLGIALVVQARGGPVSRPLLALGVLLALVAAGTWRADVTLDGGLGRRTVTPVASTSIDRHLGTGQLTIDLTKLPAGATAIQVHAEVGIGRLVVKVPKGARVATRAVTGGGATFALSAKHAGPGVDERSVSGPTNGRLVQLDLHVGLGTVEVRRG